MRIFRRIKEKWDKEGFTLIEVMVALLVLTAGFLGVIGLLFVTIEKNRFAGQLTEATNLAQDKIETLVNDGYVSSSSETTESALTATAASGGIYTRTTSVSVSSSGSSGAANYNVINVDVSWPASGTVHHVVLKTLIAP